MVAISRKLDQDTMEILEAVIQKLKEMYITPFEEMIKTRDEYLKESPLPEVNLLNSLKPFVDDRCCSAIDTLISSYNMATLARIVCEDLTQTGLDSDKPGLKGIAGKPLEEYNFQPSMLGILIPLIFLFIYAETH